MKKSTMFALIAGAFLGAELSSFNVSILSITFWVVIILGALVLNFIYAICR